MNERIDENITSICTGNEKGTGLGLFITRQIIRAHGGDITVTSRPGEWVEFQFTLPRASA